MLIKSFKLIKSILFLLVIMNLAYGKSITVKELNKYKGLETFNGQILKYGDYEKKDNITYDKKTKEKFTGRTYDLYGNGNLEGSAEYVDGIKNGFHYEYSKNKVLLLEVSYKNGIKNGIQKDYHLNGELKISTEVKNGKNNGYQYRYDEYGNLGMKLDFKDGKIQTMEVYPAAIESKNNPTGFNNVIFTATSENNGIMITYKDNLKLTEAETKIVEHESAKLAQDGKTTHFYPNGNIKITLIKRDNKTEGKILTYSESGNLIIETNAKNNKQDGEVVIYHTNGQVQLHCDRLIGEKIKGNCEIYDENGTLLHEGYFDNVSLDTLKKEKTGEIKNTKELMEVIKRYM